MKMNCTKREFGFSFLKCLGWFVGGFFLMLGLINVLVWVFGKTVAIWIAWVIVILSWIGLIAAGVAESPTLSKEQAEALHKFHTTSNHHKAQADPLG